MNSKLKLGLIVLSALLFSASFGYIVRQILKDREAESAFQSLAEYISEAASDSSEEGRITKETTTTVASVADTVPEDPVSLPVNKNNGVRRKQLIREEAESISTKPDETDPPSTVVIVETLPAETTTAVQPTEPQTAPTKPAATSAAAESGRFYNGIRNCVGWLRIEGTAINYPVMQSKDDPEFYLHHAVSGEYSYPGVPFLDARCETGVSNNLIIYGHNMKNGSMFASLHSYGEEGYYEAHPFMFISTPDKDYRLDLIAGFVTEPTSFAYIRNFDSDVQFLGYIENIKSLSDFDSDVEVKAEDHVVSLSTCTYEVDDGRYVIVGKLVELT